MNPIAVVLARFRFRLATLFALVSVVALGLTLAQRWAYIPIRNGTIYTVICRAKDLEELVSSPRSYPGGDFTLHFFGATAPPDLFKGFSPKPQLWYEISMTGPFVRGHRGRATLLAGDSNRYRRADALLRRDDERGDPSSESVLDRLRIDGTFQESALPPRRCIIDCELALVLGIRYTRWPSLGVDGIFDVLGPDGVPSTTSPIRSHLRYTGPARGLMVFSRPIDDELAQLVILDLR